MTLVLPAPISMQSGPAGAARSRCGFFFRGDLDSALASHADVSG